MANQGNVKTIRNIVIFFKDWPAVYHEVTV